MELTLDMRKYRLCFLAFLGLLALARVNANAAPQIQKLVVQPIDEAARTTLKGNTLSLARAQNDQGVVSDSTAMNRMLIVLKRSDAQKAALKTRLEAMSNPSSPYYHKWLTPKQFGSTYGPSGSDVAAVASWLGTHGFTDIQVAPGQNVIEFSGTAAQVRSAFQTEIHNYKVSGKAFVSNASDPTIPSALAPVVGGIVSLNNYAPLAQHTTPNLFSFNKSTGKWKQLTSSSATAQLSTSGTASGKVKSQFTTAGSSGTLHLVSPWDFATIYNVTPLWNASIDGTGQTIAVVARSNINKTDVDDFRASFGLPATKLNVILNGDDPGLATDEGEATLDVQWAGAVAKNATIDLIVSATTSATDGVYLSMLYAVENNIAPILSVSYGTCEYSLGTSGNLFMEEVWQQAAAQGTTVTVSAGDSGSAACDQDNGVAEYGEQVNGMASTAYNLAIGGTDFNDYGGPNGVTTSSYWSDTNNSTTQASALSYIPEMVWNSSCAGYLAVNFFGDGDAETTCNDDTVYLYGLVDTVAAGGGTSNCSTVDGSSCTTGHERPSWQKVAGVSTNTTRDVPDVSLFSANGLAGSYLVYCQSDASPDGTCNFNSSTDIAYLGSGGTSFAAPAFAGIMALVNQKTGSAQGNAAYALYTLGRNQYGTEDSPNTSSLSACNADLGKSVSSSCVFNDINTGTNSVPCEADTTNCTLSTSTDTYGVLPGFSAGAGFDLASGLGSVNAYNLVNNWAAASTTAATTTSFTLSPVKATYGDTMSFTATVSPANSNSTATPTGSIILVANKDNSGSYALASGSVSATINDLDAGTYTISASYLGDDNYQTSTSDPVTVTIAQAATTTALSIVDQDPYTGAASANGTVHYGFNAVATANVKGSTNVSTPTGTVLFTKNGASNNGTLSSGTTSYSSTGDAVGSTLIYTAAYQGDADFLASAAASQSITIVKGDTYVRVTPSATFLTNSSNVTVTAEVYTHGTGTAPSGNISLALNGSTYESLTGTAGTDLPSGGSALTATFTVPASVFASGNNTISVVYDGDGNYNSSEGSYTLGASSTTPTTTLTLTASPASATSSTVVTLQAQISANGIPVTAGMVTFYDSNTAIGTVPVVRTASSQAAVGTATLALRPAIGTHNYTARFAGTASVAAATSSAASVTITSNGKQVTGTTLTASANTTNTLNTDFAATVIGQGYLAPSGSVDVRETSVVSDLGSFALDTSTAAPAVRTISTLIPGSIVQFAQTADLNGDGYQDVVLREGSSPSSIVVYLNKGDGTFQSPIVYTVGNASRGHGIAIADINGDGIPDIVTANQTDYTLSILLGRGDGAFLPPYTISTGNMYPGNVKIVDLNHDGIPDLYVSATAIGGATFLGNGDGTFQPMHSLGLTVWSDVAELADLNGDGYPDLVHTSLEDSTIRVQMGNGDGTFATETDYTVSTGSFTPTSLKIGDVNNDGKLDLVIAGYYSSSIEVFLGNGDGTFQTKSITTQNTVLLPWYRDIVLADVNNDGKLDVAAADSADQLMILLLGNGDGTFTTSNETYTLPYPSQTIVADLDGDGAVDLIQTSQLNGDSMAAILFLGTATKGSLSNVSTLGATTSTETAVGVYGSDGNFATSTSDAVSFTGSGTKTTPAILWTPASSNWGVGEALTTSILDATTRNSVAGTFSYTAQLNGGTAYSVSASSALPTAGTYTLATAFVPNNTADYTTAASSITLTVLAADYAVSAPTDTIQLTHNSTATSTITVSSVNGYSGTVNFSCSTEAAGIGCSFSPATLNGAGASTLTLSAPLKTSTTTAANHPSMTGSRTLPLAMAGVFFFLLLLPKARKARTMLSILVIGALVLMNEGCSNTIIQPSSLVVGSSSQVAASGSTLTLTATVTTTASANKAGTVTFYDGSTKLGTATVFPAGTSGMAKLTISALSVGIHSITASYTGERDAQNSTSAVYQQLITGTTTVTVNAASGSLSRATTLNVALY